MPGGLRCSVGPCKSHGGKTKGVSFFSFPRNPQIRHEWIRKCNRPVKINADHARVCSLHFLPSDYERNLKAELLNIPCRKRLKPNAVPSLLLSVFTKETLEIPNKLDVKKTNPIVKCEKFSYETYETQQSLQKTIPNAHLQKEIEFINCEEFSSSASGIQERIKETIPCSPLQKEIEFINCEEFSSTTSGSQERSKETIPYARLQKEIEFIKCGEFSPSASGTQEHLQETNPCARLQKEVDFLKHENLALKLQLQESRLKRWKIYKIQKSDEEIIENH
ncbi:hypothetical protein ILUMI_27461 [Ignelater luminosus]|uniref:THAP-type domain-containing protein n=1 Tax=Ignelater luminosus TaxID=2038154 RepID=A0A8K0C3I1_IGNLU|nr:hypothetical protein ILUMI_27461 [Ignelater luminosus]